MRKIIIILCLAIGCGLHVQAQSLQSTPDDKILQLERQIAALGDVHCEVPCGIYGDSLRISLLYEHVATIEKAMAQINEISASDSPNYNQLIRWVMNKEHHAEEIQDIVAQYFLHQRIKMPAADADGKTVESYSKSLRTLHSVQVYAMKTKQTTDSVYIDKIRDAIHSFEHMYFGDHK